MAITPIKYYGKITPTGVDPSEARKYQALAGLADQVGDISFAVGKKIRTEQGQKAGTAAGIQAAQDGTPAESKGGLLSSVSFYDQSFNSAMESAYLAQISTDAREKFQRVAIDNPNDVEAYRANAGEIRKGIMSGVSPEYAEVVDATIGTYITSNETTVYNNQQKQSRAQANESRLNSASSSSRAAASAARDGKPREATAAIMETEVILDSMVATGDMSEIKAQELKRGQKKEVIEQSHKHELDKIVDEQGFSEAFSALGEMKRPEEFTPDEWSTFISSATQELSRAKSIKNASTAAATKETLQELKDYETAVSLGIEIAPEAQSSIAAKVAGTELESRYVQANELAAFAVMPTSERSVALQTANQEAGKLIDVDSYGKMLATEQAIQKALASDAFEFGVQQGIVSPEPFDYTDPASLTARQQDASILSEHYGVPVAPLNNRELSELASGIEGMTVNEKVALAGTLSQAPALWGKLDEKNQKMFAMAGAIGDRDIATAIFTGEEMLRNKLAKPPTATDYLSTFEDYVQDIYGNDDKAAVLQAALSHYSATATPGDEFDSGAFEDSLTAVAGDIPKLNGFKTVMPRGVTEDQFENFVDNIDADYIASLGGVANLTNEDAVDAIGRSRLYAVGDNAYEVRIDGMQSMFKRDGTPLIISYEIESAGELTARRLARENKDLEQLKAETQAMRFPMSKPEVDG
jgi:hypothetical protein